MPSKKKPASPKKAAPAKQTAPARKAAPVKEPAATSAPARPAAKRRPSAPVAKKKVPGAAGPARAKAPAAPVERRRAAPPGAGAAALPGFMRPVQPDAMLAAVLGPEPRPRTVLLRQLWVHIKRSGMQSPKDRTRFIPEKDVLELFAGKKELAKTDIAPILFRHLGEV